jgi:hypothetical protein
MPLLLLCACCALPYALPSALSALSALCAAICSLYRRLLVWMCHEPAHAARPEVIGCPVQTTRGAQHLPRDVGEVVAVLAVPMPLRAPVQCIPQRGLRLSRHCGSSLFFYFTHVLRYIRAYTTRAFRVEIVEC